ncbi:MAG: glycogen/starch synthase [Blautia sp.]|nr:glycogen/starch synthase [Blautia sp.]MDY3998624.1 glycogen/starch synthase [Blautia sp.]
MARKSATKATTKTTEGRKKAPVKKTAKTAAAENTVIKDEAVEEVKAEKETAEEAALTAEEPKKETKAKAPRKRTSRAKTVKAEETAAEAPKTEKAETPKEEKAETPKEEKAETPKEEKTETPKEEETEIPKAEEAKEEVKAETAKEEKTKKAAAKKTAAKKPAAKRTTRKAKAEEPAAEEVKPEAAPEEVKTEEIYAEEPAAEEAVHEEPAVEEPKQEIYTSPRRSVAFIGSECYPFVKTGGLGDVMYALPKALVKQNCDVKVILPRYKCIPWEYQEKMVYRGSFDMKLCSDGRSFYVGIMEYVWDGVVYDFIDNEEFFGSGNPYTNLIDDIPKYCYFAKAALAALNYMDWLPDIIHCHDWQAALVPVYLRTLFENTRLSSAKTILTIHNLRFQGIYNIPTLSYWTGLPDYVFNKDALKEGYNDANMLKGGLTYSNVITTVSNTYAGEIQTPYYGEHLDAHLRYHSNKLRGIVNGIDYDIWNSATDPRLYANYDITNVLPQKKENKRRLQEELGLVQDDHKFVIGLISRLTDQKGLDLVNAIIPYIMDEHTQIVVLGTGDDIYENSFRYYENAYKGNVCSNIMYDETRAHKIYAGADALLVPSQFEPCGLTQLIAMHYGTIPIVRETGGLKDTVEPYNMYTNGGNGFTFDKYDAGWLLDAINRAKTLYFTNRWCWDEMVQRDMDKNLSWDNSAKQYKDLYLELTW